MVAVSTNLKLVQAFGIDPKNAFGFWDWVGGRYSVTSAVGMVPLSLQYGFAVMEEFLQGQSGPTLCLLSGSFDHVCSMALQSWRSSSRVSHALPLCVFIMYKYARVCNAQWSSVSAEVDVICYRARSCGIALQQVPAVW